MFKYVNRDRVKKELQVTGTRRNRKGQGHKQRSATKEAGAAPNQLPDYLLLN